MEFATIKKLGFNALKQVMLTNVSVPFVEAVFIAAIEEGLVPWWCVASFSSVNGYVPVNITPHLRPQFGVS